MEQFVKTAAECVISQQQVMSDKITWKITVPLVKEYQAIPGYQEYPFNPAQLKLFGGCCGIIEMYHLPFFRFPMAEESKKLMGRVYSKMEQWATDNRYSAILYTDVTGNQKIAGQDLIDVLLQSKGFVLVYEFLNIKTGNPVRVLIKKIERKAA